MSDESIRKLIREVKMCDQTKDVVALFLAEVTDEEFKELVVDELKTRRRQILSWSDLCPWEVGTLGCTSALFAPQTLSVSGANIIKEQFDIIPK